MVGFAQRPATGAHEASAAAAADWATVFNSCRGKGATPESALPGTVQLSGRGGHLNLAQALVVRSEIELSS
jgi:hypothetical protein